MFGGDVVTVRAVGIGFLAGWHYSVFLHIRSIRKTAVNTVRPMPKMTATARFVEANHTAKQSTIAAPAAKTLITMRSTTLQPIKEAVRQLVR